MTDAVADDTDDGPAEADLPSGSTVEQAAEAWLEQATGALGRREHRPGQIEMAAAVTRATLDGTATLAVEAGTGTGKSLAYLAPPLALGRRLVVATATIALQGQLLGKDGPTAVEGLGVDRSIALLKGRSNYLCVQRLEELRGAAPREQLQLLGGRNRDDEMEELEDWAERTDTGDREELTPQPHHELWRAVSVTGDECPGARRCPSGDRCFAEAARNRAAEADVVITNHHYYGLHVASGGTLLPEHDVVVFDEAHHLPEVIAATTGTELSGGRFRALAARIRSIFTDTSVPEQLDRSAIDLDNLLRPHVGERAELDAELIALLVASRDRAERTIAAGRRITTGGESDVATRLERAMLAATHLVTDIDAVLDAGDDEVLWVDGTDHSPVLRRTPLDVGPTLAAHVWGKQTSILASATLTDALPAQLGLDTEVLRVGSPFDYENQALLYCPADGPDPRHPRYRENLHGELVELVEAAGGRTLALFTSARAMREAADHLRDADLDVEVLCQGDDTKAALIARFSVRPRTVLCATMSFWQGVDLPGDDLTLVTIDRIPFPRPDEPVHEARRRRAGPAAFRVVDLPRAQTLLAQAAGRLVRRADDRGVVVVFDPRLATNKSYRWDLIGALPPMRRTKDRSEVVDFLRRIDRDATGEI